MGFKMNDGRVSYEQIIFGSCVKYDRLSDIIYKAYANSTCTEVNLFIDLNSMLKYAFTVNAIRSSNMEIAASILNACAHYRAFFRSIGVETNIYLIYGLNCPSTNNQFVKGYNHKFIELWIKRPDLNKFIQDNLPILEIITQYIPNIYFFDIKNAEVSSMIDHILCTIPWKENVENIIISRDVLMLQLIPLFYNLSVIRPSKSKGEDKSFIVNRSNLWESFAKYRKIKQPEKNINIAFFQNVLTAGVPERGMYSIFSVNKMIKMIDTAVTNGLLPDRKFYTQNTISSALLAMDIPLNSIEFEMRYKAINPRFQSRYVLGLEAPSARKMRFINLEDVTELKRIIEQYFPNDPIDLDRL